MNSIWENEIWTLANYYFPENKYILVLFGLHYIILLLLQIAGSADHLGEADKQNKGKPFSKMVHWKQYRKRFSYYVVVY